MEEVKAVEHHGGLLVIDGVHEKAIEIFDFIYANKKEMLKYNFEIAEIIEWDLNQFNMIIIGCPGSSVPREAYPKLREYVKTGGFLLCTDWCIEYIIENIFPGYIARGKQRTEDTVVDCQILLPNHPFLEGVLSEIRQKKWSKGKKTKADEFQWWIEYRSIPIKVLRVDRVEILVASREIKERWEDNPVLVCFDYGYGKVIHMISHAYLQKGSDKGKYVSALIMTNIFERAVLTKNPKWVPPLEILFEPEIQLESPKAATQYKSNWEGQKAEEIRLESPKTAPQYSSYMEGERAEEIRLESPKSAPQYSSDWESQKAKEIRLESPKPAPQYSSDWEGQKAKEIRLEAPKPAPQYSSDWEGQKAKEIRLEAPKPAPQYSSDYESQIKEQSPSQIPLEEAWVTPPKATSQKKSEPLLTGTSIIIELEKMLLDEVCVYCGHDFKDYDKKIYMCKECGSYYHEKCLTHQLNHGMCKKCERILLW
jgi:hypothetical protein